ncbi:hypothetical protein B0T26DRAFT_868027 [Lasiosphaeria miniovina]|uniref:BTB domain-containing protein n=1 Tax=Lasiosphaeria miniovina TaxID=1954250 RepID=A0AA40EE70_9PEZI|nr:uncharacterized protein B0T26DRAFT_868027 [Lasiosphaeria miniovina]KAK0735127.1 hypothetical protein B0T26DRAFT_868027 [Lasiosphaeria miniovina]
MAEFENGDTFDWSQLLKLGPDNGAPASPSLSRQSRPPRAVSHTIREPSDRSYTPQPITQYGGPQHNGPIEVLDDRGDLILAVGDNQIQFQVCSRTLARASPYLREKYFTNDHYLECEKKESVDAFEIEKRLFFPGIESRPFHIVLMVIHGLDTRVYHEFADMMLLRDVLAVAHHFEMTRCLSPIVGKWLKKVYNKDVARHDEAAAQLWITHQLGHLGCIKQTIYNMVIKGRLNSRGDLVGYGASDNEPYIGDEHVRALNLLADIIACRKRIMDRLLETVKQAGVRVDTYDHHLKNARPRADRPCRGRTAQRVCEMNMATAFRWAFRASELEGLDQKCSPSSVHKRMIKMEQLTRMFLEPLLLSGEMPAGRDHKNCMIFPHGMPNLFEIATREVEAIPFKKEDIVSRAADVGFDFRDGKVN